MSENDPFEILAAHRDPELDRPLSPGDDPAAEQMLNHIIHSPSTSADRPRNMDRVRRAVAALFAVSVVATGAVAIARWVSQPEDQARLACYSDAAIDPPEQFALLIDPSRTPIEQCATLWQDGRLGSSETPELSACVSGASITVVVPGGGGTCGDLGLADLDPEAPANNVAALVVRGLSDAFTGPCLATVDEALDLTRSVLAEAGATDWTVDVQGDVTNDRPCLKPAPLPEERRVLLVPTPAAP